MYCPYHRSVEDWFQDFQRGSSVASECPCIVLSKEDSDAAFLGNTPQASPTAYAPDADIALYLNLNEHLLDANSSSIHPNLAINPLAAPIAHQAIGTQYAPEGADPANTTNALQHHTYGGLLASTPPFAQAPAITVGGAAETVCFFGGPCDHLTLDMLPIQSKISVIQKHLKEHHEPTSGFTKDRCGNVICEWKDAAGPCAKAVGDGLQLAKHVATVHLKLFQIKCGGCGQMFSRKDSLDRHLLMGRCFHV
ncbi:uncharacterized protein C8Q71DRAFT_765616 [Rhodofomes roseus]|uniref:C2H2-type domain-containing protein n=1 Tax=Rhodofomes roseus TaxID=34475 RepID=A0ABQ8KCT6_9APHY|nr:uncharacterized protein C8Q71DRAFT_765616 [Rhodofomes roseus]KAH9835378.1 hypothetical protein C8Q71DRAFT_765616 [Rhodofomes roseus]